MSEQTTAIDLDLRNDFNDKVPRVRDIDLGKKLGLAQPRDVRRTIDAHLRILNACGVVARRARTSGPLGGRPTTEYWLNREQALIVASRSETEVGEQTLLMLVQAFSLFEQMLVERLPPFLRATHASWRKTWQDDLMIELCTLRGELFTGKHPRWCARMNSIIYECLLGKELYAALKVQNPRPSKGRNHHQLIGAEYRLAFEAQLAAVIALAKNSNSLFELESRLRFTYQKRPMQLEFFTSPQMPGPRKALPRAPQKLASRGAG